jgi:hypothetical protein
MNCKGEPLRLTRHGPRESGPAVVALRSAVAAGPGRAAAAVVDGAGKPQESPLAMD